MLAPIPAASFASAAAHLRQTIPTTKPPFLTIYAAALNAMAISSPLLEQLLIPDHAPSISLTKAIGWCLGFSEASSQTRPRRNTPSKR